LDDAIVEEGSGEDKEAKKENLNAQPGRDDVLTEAECGLGFGCCEDTSAYSYHQHKKMFKRSNNIPALCAKKLKTSPPTNTFVNHLALITECVSPSVNRIILPRIMYIDAAKRAGARRMRRD
jgi:hypothetical protein